MSAKRHGINPPEHALPPHSISVPMSWELFILGGAGFMASTRHAHGSASAFDQCRRVSGAVHLGRGALTSTRTNVANVNIPHLVGAEDESISAPWVLPERQRMLCSTSVSHPIVQWHHREISNSTRPIVPISPFTKKSSPTPPTKFSPSKLNPFHRR